MSLHVLGLQHETCDADLRDRTADPGDQGITDSFFCYYNRTLRPYQVGSSRLQRTKINSSRSGEQAARRGAVSHKRLLDRAEAFSKKQPLCG
jgi:hypothetical protein